MRRLGLGKNNHLSYASLALNPRTVPSSDWRPCEVRFWWSLTPARFFSRSYQALSGGRQSHILYFSEILHVSFTTAYCLFTNWMQNNNCKWRLFGRFVAANRKTAECSKIVTSEVWYSFWSLEVWQRARDMAFYRVFYSKYMINIHLEFF